MVWLTTHGIGAIRNSASTFSIQAVDGSARIGPTDGKEKEGWVHYTIPSPDDNHTILSKIKLDISADRASINEVKLWLGNDLAFDKGTLQKRNSWIEPVSPTATYSDAGISVALYLKFPTYDSSIDIQSIGVYGASS
jgi:hypothetical protein